MGDNLDNSLKRTHYVIFIMAISLLSLYFTDMHFMLCREAKDASLSLLLHGSADVPFQYRVLIPWGIKFLLNLHLPFLNSTIRLFKIIEFFFTFFLFVAFRFYLSIFIQNEIRSSLFSLLLFLVLPYQYIFYSASLRAIYYPCDIPSVFFFTMGIILIYRKNWFLYYPLFIIATFNRETSIFLVFIFWVTTIEKNRTANVFIHCILQIMIWLIIKKTLGILYANNPGPGYFINFLFINLKMLLNPVNAVRVLSSFCFVWGAVVLYFKHISEPFVKKSLAVLIPFGTGMLIVGNIIELRIYGEMIPVVLSAFAMILNSLFSSCNISKNEG